MDELKYLLQHFKDEENYEACQGLSNAYVLFKQELDEYDFDILRDITQEVCKADLMKETREREVVYARMIMYKVLHSFHKHTATRIGRMFGKNTPPYYIVLTSSTYD